MIVLPPIWSSAPPPRTLGTKQVHVWAWLLDTATALCHGHNHLSWLDAEERERFHRFHFNRDRAFFALAHANTRRILGAYLRRRPADLSFRANPFGKPELATDDPAASIHFNLTHSRELALLALSTDTPVGVDVEAVRPMEREIASHHFSTNENLSLSSLYGDAWLNGFYRCWTRKEAIVKAEGVGLSLPLHAFDVSLLPGEPAKLLAVRSPAAFRHAWTLHDLSVPEGHVASLATGDPEAEVRCFRLPESHP